MTPTPIEAAHGRKLIAVVVPKEAKDFSILPSHRGIRYRLCKEYHGHPEGEVEVKYVELTIDTEAAILGTLHHDGDKWVSSFDVEPFIPLDIMTNERFANLKKQFSAKDWNRMITEPKELLKSNIECFISLLNSYGVGYLTNPLGEKPSPSNYESLQEPTVQSPDDTERYNGDLSAWLKAEEGVLKPNQQYLFIEQV